MPPKRRPSTHATTKPAATKLATATGAGRSSGHECQQCGQMSRSGFSKVAQKHVTRVTSLLEDIALRDQVNASKDEEIARLIEDLEQTREDEYNMERRRDEMRDILKRTQAKLAEKHAELTRTQAKLAEKDAELTRTKAGLSKALVNQHFKNQLLSAEMLENMYLRDRISDEDQDV